jgi:hypothetical protein
MFRASELVINDLHKGKLRFKLAEYTARMQLT